MKTNNNPTPNNLDQNRIDAMVDTYVNQDRPENADRMPFLWQLAARMTEPADVLAGFLLAVNYETLQPIYF